MYLRTENSERNYVEVEKETIFTTTEKCSRAF